MKNDAFSFVSMEKRLVVDKCNCIVQNNMKTSYYALIDYAFARDVVHQPLPSSSHSLHYPSSSSIELKVFLLSLCLYLYSILRFTFIWENQFVVCFCTDFNSLSEMYRKFSKATLCNCRRATLPSIIIRFECWKFASEFFAISVPLALTWLSMPSSSQIQLNYSWNSTFMINRNSNNKSSIISN